MSARRDCTLIAAVLAVLIGVPVFDLSTGAAARPQRNAPEPDPPPDHRTPLDRALTRASTTARLLRGPFNEVMLAWFGATPREVVTTRTGWLFYGAGLAEPREPATTAILDDRIGLTVAAARFGERAGMRCVVWLVPEKWRVHPEQAPGLTIGPLRRALYARIRTRLLELGLDAPDVLAELTAVRERRPELELASSCDSHLSEDGYAAIVARFAAPALALPTDAVAQRLAALPRGEPTTECGDLLAMLQIPPTSAAARRYAPTFRPWLAPATVDAPDAEVLVLGDSNAEVHDRLLPRLVQAATGARADARFVPTTFAALAGIAQARSDHGGGLLLIVLGERMFATEW